MTLPLPPAGPPDPDKRGSLRTPRNLLILMIAALGTQQGVPAVLPMVEVGSPSWLLAYVALVIALDQVVTP